MGKAATLNEMNIQCLIQKKVTKITSAYRYNMKVPKFLDLFGDSFQPVNNTILNCHEILGFVMLLIASTYQIYIKLDWIGFQLPISYLFQFIFLGCFKGAILSSYRNHTQLYDVRLTKLEEMLRGIVLIKTNAWESVMEHFVNKKRTEDKQVLKSYNIAIGLSESLLIFYPFGQLFAIFYLQLNQSVYTGSFHTADAYEIFLYVIVLSEPCKKAFYFWRNYTMSKDLFLRLTHFMGLEEYSPLKNDEGVTQGEILFTNATFSWNSPESKKNEVMMNNLVRDPHFYLLSEFVQSPPKTQTNINLHIKPRTQNGIIGLQGAGKSSLLNAVCDEMIHGGGELKKSGRIGYVAKEPFQMKGYSIRFNIIFGQEYNPMRFDKVIYACEQKGVFKKFQSGDYSKIGDKNVYLNKSVMQRMMLARAIYSDPDIYLIDDIWNDFDKKMANKLWDKLILFELSTKTRLMVTSNILNLQNFDNIILMDQGKVSLSGPLPVINSNDAYFNFLRSAKDIRIFDTKVVKDIQDFFVNIEEAETLINEVKELDRVNILDQKQQKITKGKTHVQGLIEEMNKNDSASSDQVETPSRRSNLFKIDGSIGVSIDELDLKQNNPEMNSSFYETAKIKDRPLAQKQPFTVNEPKKMYYPSLQHFVDMQMELKGEEEFVRRRHKKKFEYHDNTEFTIWCEYLREGGWCCMTYISYFLILGSMMTCTYALGEWLEAASTSNHKHQEILQYTYMIALITLAVMLLFRTVAHARNYSNASNQIHGKMLYNLLRRPMKWFTNNSGDMIPNEFRNDLETIDVNLPYHIQSAIYYWLCTLSAFIVCLTLMPLSINQLIGLFAMYIMYFNRMLKVTTELRHLKEKNFMELTKFLTQFLTGGTHLRIYNHFGFKQKIFDRYLNKQITISLHEKYALASITFNQEFVSTLFLIVFLSFSGANRQANINMTNDASILSAALAWCFYSMQFVITMAMQSDSIVDMMRSVEYVRSWILDDELEPEWVIPKAPANWPTDGYIIARTLNVRYEKTEPRAISNISFKINGGDKVGIIGRTGSGKTTLLNYFMRTVDSEKDSFGIALGTLFIDGKNIEDICLHGIRRKIMLIPQNINLLNGNQIFNIDPLMQYSDEEILSALKKARVWDLFYNQMREEKKINQHESVPYKPISTNTRRLTLLRETNDSLISAIPADIGYHPMSNTMMGSGLNSGLQNNLMNGNSQTENMSIGTSKVQDSTNLQMNFEEKEFDLKIFNSRVERQGSSLSVRERQLIYLAKAILMKPKILQIDEMTYDLDPDTWKVFHEILDKEFKDVTTIHVLTKLNNLREYNKIIMLDNGEIIENGEPNRQLGDPESFQFKLVGEFGKEFDTMDVDQDMRLAKIEEVNESIRSVGSESEKFGSDSKKGKRRQRKATVGISSDSNSSDDETKVKIEKKVYSDKKIRIEGNMRNSGVFNVQNSFVQEKNEFEIV